MEAKKIRKGCLVRLNKEVCFTKRNGGGRDYPMINGLNDDRGTVEARRPVTAAETAEWYASDASKGMTSAGETKLPPQCTHVLLYSDRVYTVLRARARVRLGWGNPTPGMTKLQCTHTGEEAYIKRALVEAV